MINSNSDQRAFGTTHSWDDGLNRSRNQAYSPKSFATFCKRLGQPVLHWLTEGSDLKIREQTQAGTQGWEVYDSVTNETLHFEHEEALRTWLEQRYND
ncbi:MAG: hypothetical protein AAGE59_04680 [Cyanobacteria bacterium P01_F01_bin.86]